MSSSQHALTYSSDLIIRSPSTLASLSVFFDRVYLPHIPARGSGAFLRVFGDGDNHAADIVESDISVEYWHRWDGLHASLFAAGVLQRLPAAPRDIAVDDKALQNVTSALYPNVNGFSRRMYFLARVIHHLRSDHEAPLLIDTTCSKPTRNGYKWLLAQEVFSYLVPALGVLPAEELLEIRCRVADTREGFAMHLQKLSGDLEARIKSGDPAHVLALHARAVVETELIPDVVEFRRQLLARRTGVVARVLDAAGGVLRLSVPIGTSAIASTGTSEVAGILQKVSSYWKPQATNAVLAYRFLEKLAATVEEAAHLERK